MLVLMNKQAVTAQREYFKMVNGITLKLITTFTDADLDYRPKDGMRTVRDLISHMYGFEKALAEGICAGKLTQEAEDMAIPESAAGKATAAQLTSIEKCAQFAKDAHQRADEVAAGLTDADLAKPVDAPFGKFSAAQCLGFAYDEHWHHRGQLYIYARLLGRNPPMLYAY
jgi:uncharacterized damage-inducible protein DinB